MSEEKTDPYARLQDRLAKTADGLEYPQDAQKKAIHDFPFRFNRVSNFQPNELPRYYRFLAGLHTLSMKLELETVDRANSNQSAPGPE